MSNSDTGLAQEEMNKAQKKGRRNENEAKNILGGVWRKPERVDGYANTDPWNIADVIALDPNIDPGVLIAQVKTNRFTKQNRKKIRSRARSYVPTTVRIEVWVRVDYEGWRVFKLDWETGEFVEIVHMDSCDRDETTETYREAVDFWPKDKASFDERMPPRWNDE